MSPERERVNARVVGRGRAGTAFADALGRCGWSVDLVGREADPAGLGHGVDLVLLCVPDAQVAPTAAAIDVAPETVIAHVAGSLTLEVLRPHPRPASVHPLVSLPGGPIGAQRLLAGGWFAVAGDPLASQVVDALGGRSVEVPDRWRVRYHAAACVAANHVVALLGQVERLAESMGLPRDLFVDLSLGAVANTRELGARAALTGPVARGDFVTVRRHLGDLPAAERATYLAGVVEAGRCAGRRIPALDPIVNDQQPGRPYAPRPGVSLHPRGSEPDHR